MRTSTRLDSSSSALCIELKQRLISKEAGRRQPTPAQQSGGARQKQDTWTTSHNPLHSPEDGQRRTHSTSHRTAVALRGT
ncbi:hypothetical protein MHYP_G00149460 [Metynnis hypsauchen]